MKIFPNPNPSLSDLAHHGVKGQRWGVRKAHPSSGQIHAARTRQRNLADTVNKQESKARDTKLSSRQRMVAIKKADAAGTRMNTSEDRVTAHRLTVGEKAVATLLGGPVGLVVIGVNNHRTNKIAKSVDKARAKA